MNEQLKSAFRFHMRNKRPAFYHAQGYNGRNTWPEKAHGMAVEALARARKDVTEGKTRYPHAIRSKYRASESDGLRYVGRVIAECGGRNGHWDSNERCGWHADQMQQEVAYGVVYQLPARNGQARYVAGYDFSHIDGGPSLDLSTIYSGGIDDNCSYERAQGSVVAREAARAADHMAQRVAEQEREYSIAWHAGSIYAQEKADSATIRQEIIGILQERKAVKTDPNAYPALCNAIRARVQSLLSDLRQRQINLVDLARGEYRDLYFSADDTELQERFCEGADIDSFPA